jgi:hypothetical protein
VFPEAAESVCPWISEYAFQAYHSNNLTFQNAAGGFAIPPAYLINTEKETRKDGTKTDNETLQQEYGASGCFCYQEGGNGYSKEPHKR